MSVPPGALRAPSQLTIQRVGDESLPQLPPGLLNITEGGGGFRFLPENQRFQNAVKVSLPLRQTGKAGYWAALKAKTFFWDGHRGRWEPLPTGKMSSDGRRLESTTLHFSLMINAVVQAPEHASPANFNENAISSIGAGDPTTNVDLIQPPDVNNQGDAQITFPIRLPRGRGAYSPQLAISYSSANGNGPLGIGWDLSLSRIAVDTRLGVPDYDGSERYLLDGVSLIRVGKAASTSCLRRRGNDQDRYFRVVDEFAARIHHDQRIVLCERQAQSDNEKNERYWEVVQRDGTRHYYGVDEAHRVEMPGDEPRTATWLLQEVEDPNRNVTLFSYKRDQQQTYLERIAYTSHLAPDSTGNILEDLAAAYAVDLTWECDSRADRSMSARFGFVIMTRCRLETIAISVRDSLGNSQPVRSYALQYGTSPFDGRTLLTAVRVSGAAGSDFYEHKFTYSEPEYRAGRPTADVPCEIQGAFCKTKTWPLNASLAVAPEVRSQWPLDFTDEETYAASQSGGVSFKWGAGEGLNAGCSVGGSTGVFLEFPTPKLRLVDINGDGVVDRVWDHGNGQLQAALGSPGEWNTAPQLEGISYLESQSALGASQSAEGGCGIGPATASTSQAISLRLSASDTTLYDADGDGRVDLLSGGVFYRGLPGLCRDGKPPDQCANAVCTCSADGLPACKDPSLLCFASPQALSTLSPSASNIPVISTGLSPRSASVSSQGQRHAQRRSTMRVANMSAPEGAQLVEPGRAPAQFEAEGRLGALDPVPSGPQPGAPSPVCQALEPEANWGPYTSARRRMEKEGVSAATFEPALTVIRWEAQHTGTVLVTARMRRPYCGGEDGVEVTLLKVTDFFTPEGTETLQTIWIEPKEPSWKPLAQGRRVDVKFGDSLLFVYDTRADVPISDQGIAIDQIISDIAIDYTRVCPLGDACRDLRPEEIRLHRGPTGYLAYQYRYPGDFRTSELPRYTYWQMVPPLGPARQPDGSNQPSYVTASINKKEKTKSTVHVRLRCESLASQKAGDAHACPLGTILKDVVLQPNETGTQKFVVNLPEPFTDGGSTLPPGPECYAYNRNNLSVTSSDSPFGVIWYVTDGPVLMGAFTTQQQAEAMRNKAVMFTRYCDFGRALPGQPLTLSEYVHDYFALEAPDAPPPAHELQDCVPYAPASLRVEPLPEGKWVLRAGTTRLMAFDTQQHAEDSKQVVQNYSGLCYVGRANTKSGSTLGFRHRDYVVQYFEGALNGIFDPMRLLLEVDGENGREVPPTAVAVQADLVATSLRDVRRVELADGSAVLQRTNKIYQFDPAKRPQMRLRTLYRVHPARQLRGFRIDKDKQTLILSATIVDPLHPLHLTLVRDGVDTPVWGSVVLPSDVATGQRAVTKHFSICMPRAGQYYIRGYTEASFDPSTAFKVSAWLVAGGDFSACATPGTSSDAGPTAGTIISGNTYALVGKDPSRCEKLLSTCGTTIAVLAGSEAEKLAKCLYPCAKVISVAPNSPGASFPGKPLPAGLTGKEALAWVIKNGIVDAAFVDGLQDAVNLQAPGVSVCCIQLPKGGGPETPGSCIDSKDPECKEPTVPAKTCVPAQLPACYSGTGPGGYKLTEVPVNLLTAEFGTSYYESWKLENLVGEVPYSFDPYAGGHHGFFYGIFRRDEEQLACLGPYACGNKPPAPVQVALASPIASSSDRPHQDWNQRLGDLARMAAEQARRGEARESVEDKRKKPDGPDAPDDCKKWDGDCDGDGIPNAADDCPTEPSTNESGCPPDPCTRDIDQDGVPDCRDDCPFVPGSFAGHPGRGNGCPDSIPPWLCRGCWETPEPGGTNTPGTPPEQGGQPNPPGTPGDCYAAAGWATWICGAGSPGGGGGCSDGGCTHPSSTNSNAGGNDGDGDGGDSTDVDGFRRTWVFGVNTSQGLAISSASVSGTVNFGAQYTDRDVLDWNGDGLVDFVSPDVVTLGARNSSVELQNQDCYLKLGDNCVVYPGVRESLSASVGFSAGASGNIFGGGGQQTRELKTEPGGPVKAQASGNVTFGLSAFYNRSATISERLDMNGDGLPDQVFGSKDDSTVTVRLNLGRQLDDPRPFPVDPPMPKAEGGLVAELVNRILNVVDRSPISIENSFTCSDSAGGGGGVNVGMFGGEVAVSYNESRTLTESVRQFVDVNGDGLVDIVIKRPETSEALFVAFNLGDQFTAPTPFAVPGWSPSVQGSDYLDGLDNLGELMPDSPDPLGLSGSRTDTWAGNTCATVFFVEGCTSFSYTQGHSTTQSTFRDIDGDGIPDRILRTGDANGAVQVQRGLFGGANLLKKIERPFGGVITMLYALSTPTEEAPRAKWNLKKVTVDQGSDVHKALCGTATEQACGSNRSPALVSTYTYANGYYDRYEKESFGYRKVSITREGDGRIVEREYENRDYWLKGTLVAERIKDAIGTKLTEVLSTYDTVPWPGLPPANYSQCRGALILPQRYLDTQPLRDAQRTPCDVRARRLLRTERRYYEGGSSYVASFQQVDEYDGYGNVRKVTEQYEGANQPTLVATIDYDDRPVLLGQHAVARAKRLVVRGGSESGTFLRRREAQYDNRGNLKHHEVWADAAGAAGKTAVLELTPDPFGFVTKVSDANAYEVSFTPDSLTHSLPETTSDNLGLSGSTSYDWRFQQPTNTTDINGNIIERHYDQFGRLEKVRGPYERAAGIDTIRIEYSSLMSPQYPIRVLTTSKSVNPDTNQLHTTLHVARFADGFGREVQVQTEAEVNSQQGWRVSGRVQWDSAGRKVTVSEPVFRPSMQFTFYVIPWDTTNCTTTGPVYCTQTTYDSLDRALSTTQPGGITSVLTYALEANPRDASRQLRRTQITDAESKVRRVFYDTADRLSGVVELLQGRELKTTYDYSVVGDLVAMTDARDNVRTFEYDLAGRRTSITTLDTGRMEMAYDSMGNLVAQTDQELCSVSPPLLTAAGCAGKIIKRIYDKNRLVAIDYPNSPDIAFVYGDADPNGLCGGAANAKGRVCWVQDGAGTERRSFGALGDMRSQARTLPMFEGSTETATYTTGFRNDSFGRMLWIQYPDGEKATYSYDVGGRVKSVSGTRESLNTVYVQNRTYDVYGKPQATTLGNGVIESNDYELDTQRLKRRQASRGNVLLWSLEIAQYDKVGNVKNSMTQRNEAQDVSRLDRSYTYDDLHRLDTFAVTGKHTDGSTALAVSGNYDYDDVGNITLQQITGSGSAVTLTRDWAYAYGTPTHPNLPDTIGPKAFAYDGRGALTTITNGSEPTTFSWSDYGQLNSATIVPNGAAQPRVLSSYRHTSDRTRSWRQVKVSEASKTVFELFHYPNPYYTARATRTREGACNDDACATLIGSRTKQIRLDGVTVASVVGLVEPGWAGDEASMTYVTSAPNYLHADQVRSTVVVTGSSGSTATIYEYLPFGDLVASASTPDVEGIVSFASFSGMEYEAATDLLYFGARSYAPSTGRWLSPDPSGLSAVGVGMRTAVPSLYVFSHNNPIRFFDPDGAEPEAAIEKGAAGAGMLAEGAEGTFTIREYLQRGRQLAEWVWKSPGRMDPEVIQSSLSRLKTTAMVEEFLPRLGLSYLGFAGGGATLTGLLAEEHGYRKIGLGLQGLGLTVDAIAAYGTAVELTAAGVTAGGYVLPTVGAFAIGYGVGSVANKLVIEGPAQKFLIWASGIEKAEELEMARHSMPLVPLVPRR